MKWNGLDNSITKELTNQGSRAHRAHLSDVSHQVSVEHGECIRDGSFGFPAMDGTTGSFPTFPHMG